MPTAGSSSSTLSYIQYFGEVGKIFSDRGLQLKGCFISPCSSNLSTMTHAITTMYHFMTKTMPNKLLKSHEKVDLANTFLDCLSPFFFSPMVPLKKSLRSTNSFGQETVCLAIYLLVDRLPIYITQNRVNHSIEIQEPPPMIFRLISLRQPAPQLKQAVLDTDCLGVGKEKAARRRKSTITKRRVAGKGG